MTGRVDLETAAYDVKRIANQVALIELAAEGAIADGDNEHAPKFRDAALCIAGQLDTMYVELDRLAGLWLQEQKAAKAK